MAVKTFARNVRQLMRSSGVLFAGFMIVFLQNGSFKAFGVLFKSVVEEYHSNNMVTGGIFSFELAACYIIAGVSGTVISKKNNRMMAVIGGIFFGSGLVFQGTLGKELWHFFVLMGLTAVGIGFLYFAVIMAYVEHFGELFYLAYSLRDVFFYLGVIIVPPVVEFLRGRYGMQGTFLIMGGIMWNGVVAGILLKPSKHANTRMRTAYVGDIESRQPSSKNHELNTCLNNDISFFGSSTLTSHPLFALSVVVHSLTNFNFVIWALFLVPFGISLGYHPELAAMLSTAGGIGGFGGKVVVIIVFCRGMMTQIISNALPGAIICIALAGYIVVDNYILLLIFSVMCGFSLSFADAATCAMIPQYICDRHLRSGTQILYFFGGLLTQLGGIVAGAVLDFSSSFQYVFGVMAVVNIVIIVIAIVMKRVEERAVYLSTKEPQTSNPD